MSEETLLEMDVENGAAGGVPAEKEKLEEETIFELTVKAKDFGDVALMEPLNLKVEVDNLLTSEQDDTGGRTSDSSSRRNSRSSKRQRKNRRRRQRNNSNVTDVDSRKDTSAGSDGGPSEDNAGELPICFDVPSVANIALQEIDSRISESEEPTKSNGHETLDDPLYCEVLDNTHAAKVLEEKRSSNARKETDKDVVKSALQCQEDLLDKLHEEIPRIVEEVLKGESEGAEVARSHQNETDNEQLNSTFIVKEESSTFVSNIISTESIAGTSEAYQSMVQKFTNQITGCQAASDEVSAIMDACKAAQGSDTIVAAGESTTKMPLPTEMFNPDEIVHLLGEYADNDIPATISFDIPSVSNISLEESLSQQSTISDGKTISLREIADAGVCTKISAGDMDHENMSDSVAFHISSTGNLLLEDSHSSIIETESTSPKRSLEIFSMDNPTKGQINHDELISALENLNLNSSVNTSTTEKESVDSNDSKNPSVDSDGVNVPMNSVDNNAGSSGSGPALLDPTNELSHAVENNSDLKPQSSTFKGRGDFYGVDNGNSMPVLSYRQREDSLTKGKQEEQLGGDHSVSETESDFPFLPHRTEALEKKTEKENEVQPDDIDGDSTNETSKNKKGIKCLSCCTIS